MGHLEEGFGRPDEGPWLFEQALIVDILTFRVHSLDETLVVRTRGIGHPDSRRGSLVIQIR